MKIVLIGDLHIQGKNPICRIDDLVETQFTKIKEIIDFANTHKSPIVSVGDIFNTSVVANSLVNRFGNLLHDLKSNFYFVWGNHDLLYHTHEMWEKTSLGVLLINHPKVKHISEFEKDYGFPWDYLDWDKRIVENDSNILLSHKAIYSIEQSKKSFWISKDTDFGLSVTDKSLKNYKWIFCGHWHKPYFFKYKNIKVLNPGPVVRVTKDDRLSPSVCLINLSTGVYKRHKLISAKPYQEVLSETHIKKVKSTQHITDFIKSLQLKNVKDSSAFMGSLEQMLKSNLLSLELKNILTKLLSKIKERKNK